MSDIQFGISTASLFLRKYTEDALKYLSENNVKTCEVFLSTYSEYESDFAKKLKEVKGDINVHSMHVLTTQYEPQLFNSSQRTSQDAFKMLEKAVTAGEIIGAKYYTFHGTARYKVTPIIIDYDKIGAVTSKIIDVCNKHNITLCFENVHWAHYNFIGFFTELKKRCPTLKGVLDIKQAWQNKIPYQEFLNEMKGDIVTVHLSDIDENGKMCLPGKGKFDFKEMFSRLKDVGFKGSALIEVYKDNYEREEELLESLEYLKNIAK